MDQLVYIARALDGSWAEIGDSMDCGATCDTCAMCKIRKHEPDEAKQSGYQILVEPLGKLMADAIPGIKRGLQQNLVKWEGDPPEGGIPADAATHPHKYPQVVEVIEGGDGVPTRTLYRRP